MRALRCEGAVRVGALRREAAVRGRGVRPRCEAAAVRGRCRARALRCGGAVRAALCEHRAPHAHLIQPFFRRCAASCRRIAPRRCLSLSLSLRFLLSLSRSCTHRSRRSLLSTSSRIADAVPHRGRCFRRAAVVRWRRTRLCARVCAAHGALGRATRADPAAGACRAADAGGDGGSSGRGRGQSRHERRWRTGGAVHPFHATRAAAAPAALCDSVASVNAAAVVAPRDA